MITFICISNLNNNSTILLGENESGKVTLEGPYGNPNSTNKIAVIIGVHPLEFKSHQSLLKYIKKYSNSLNSSYYVYIVDVTKNNEDFDKSRDNGQLLAQKFVVPDIMKKNYSITIDFHGHRAFYVEDNFIISPLNDNKSTEIAKDIVKNINGFELLNFVPATDDHPTSPEYVSIPILKSGIPSLIYETNIYQSQTIIDKFMLQFILNLDKINF
ncbi:hypothetical protein [Methanobrevibacter curvatus]|uniref:Succinylglutamate desuccinylase / aspartoacylase family protein n=1 Tax=Methanobrevibacter curvatus TaxID=49547 RepID=A0A166CCD9_9EURY|nr:hypothetical protein [Methanobrevibacter curvatus]KZX13097.1 hypothetical protein MBCUR_07850 [Methanobrevibacter curvatus]